jgi:hypothetical protein
MLYVINIQTYKVIISLIITCFIKFMTLLLNI